MECPNCGVSGVTVLSNQNEIKRVSCRFCLTESEVVDTAMRAARLRAEADARADDVIRSKVDSAVSSITEGLRKELETAMRGLPRSDVDAGVKVYEDNINGILEIRCGNSAGSGFIVAPQGYAVTNAHVICDQKGNINGAVKVLAAGQWVGAQVVKVMGESGSTNDVALLKLERMPSGAHPVKLGNSDALKNGQQSFVIGNSRGEGTCIMVGVVSDKNRRGFVLTNDTAKAGNSGGPIFSRDGVVISVLTAGRTDHVQGITLSQKENVVVALDDVGMNYSIPINHVKALISRYI